MWKAGHSKNWKVVYTPTFQIYGKVMKLCVNMVFPTSFQRFNLIGKAYIFCSVRYWNQTIRVSSKFQRNDIIDFGIIVVLLSPETLFEAKRLVII